MGTDFIYLLYHGELLIKNANYGVYINRGSIANSSSIYSEIFQSEINENEYD